MVWKGWLIEESLENVSILPELKITNSIVEENEAGEKIETWHLHTIEVDDKDIDKIAKELEKLLKRRYYVHFTNYKNLLIIFRGKHFTIKLQKVLKEDKFGATEFKADPKDLGIWKSATDYGTKEGKVDPRYLVKIV